MSKYVRTMYEKLYDDLTEIVKEIRGRKYEK